MSGAPTLVLGTGLIGTSVALALRAAGREVVLDDPAPEALRAAVGRGAGRPWRRGEPLRHAVVASPPGAVADVLRDLFASNLTPSVSDVASIKSSAALEIETLGPHLSRYVGGHPMAGSERAGPAAARADLFIGRPWAVTAHPTSSPEAVAEACAVAVDCGAVVVELSPDEHDAAVALVSHLPHVMASVLAAAVGTAGDERSLALVGQGLRDSTRIAGGSPTLWTDILVRNAAQVGPLLAACARRLEDVVASLGGPEAGPALTGLMEEGNAALARLPGKHSAVQERLEPVVVVLRDAPGQLAAVLAAAHAAGVNVEDIGIEHAPGAALGVVRLVVLAGAGAGLAATLAAHGWSATVEAQ